jgi:nucleoside-diphosphate-sugar epimerase
MKVLMVGATGKYAGHVVPELKQRNAAVRALVRDKDKVDAARQQVFVPPLTELKVCSTSILPSRPMSRSWVWRWLRLLKHRVCGSSSSLV